MTPALHAAIAAHRFGLGEPDLAVVGADAPGWLLAQVGPADAQRGDKLADVADGLRLHIAFQRRLVAPVIAGGATQRLDGQMATGTSLAQMDSRPIEQQFGDTFREVVQADLRARLATAASTRRPFAERLAAFWSNHFTVSMAKATARALVGAFEREAIRPHVAARFVDLLKASSHHAAMLRYLDNHLSAGPQSRYVRRLNDNAAERNRPGRPSGLNENLAREILELHTLGVSQGGGAYGPWGGYGQADVSAFAAVLTGWRVPGGLRETVDAGGTRFDPAWHEPGAKTVMGQRYGEGPQALDEVLEALARHPSTARHIATKLARHFVADAPPLALVQRLARRFQASDGQLSEVYAELVAAPEAWEAAQPKLKTPEEFVLSSARLLGLGERVAARAADAGLAALGQRLHAAPSPAGWPDRAEEWLGPDAVWKRVEWASALAERMGRQVDARALAARSLGPLLSTDTARQIERAADGPQALALLLLAPEFQRR